MRLVTTVLDSPRRTIIFGFTKELFLFLNLGPWWERQADVKVKIWVGGARFAFRPRRPHPTPNAKRHPLWTKLGLCDAASLAFSIEKSGIAISTFTPVTSAPCPMGPPRSSTLSLRHFMTSSGAALRPGGVASLTALSHAPSGMPSTRWVPGKRWPDAERLP